MNGERRKHPRVARPLEGSFSGASGAATCRISDISLGGCFIQSLAKPKPGEPISVSVRLGGQAMTFHGVVVYVETSMGFAVQFKDVEVKTLEDLSHLLVALERGEINA